jgi:hypothetical protein
MLARVTAGTNVFRRSDETEAERGLRPGGITGCRDFALEGTFAAERRFAHFPAWPREVARMAKPQDYRRYAAECLRLAQEFGIRAEAGLLLEMAERWRRLAEQSERGCCGSKEGK